MAARPMNVTKTMTATDGFMACLTSASFPVFKRENRGLGPGEIDFVAHLDLRERRRVLDACAVFPAVRSGEGDRRHARVERGNGRGDRALARDGTGRSCRAHHFSRC